MVLSNDRVALITGASSGIGAALATALAARGVTVALVARRAERLEQLARLILEAGGVALAIPCDVTIRGDFQRAVTSTIERFGHLDILVNNAGRGHNGYIEQTTDEQIESIFRLNVFALWFGTSEALRHMRERDSGLILNVASMAGTIGFPGNAAYVASKHATIGFTRALRSELAGTGIEAIAVIPGGVATDWASVTEGGPMHEIFAYEATRGREIARERGIEPPAIPVLSAEEVAAAIVEAIENPEPEIYTHPGTALLANAFQTNQRSVEERFEPLWLANREAYLSSRNVPPGNG